MGVGIQYLLRFKVILYGPKAIHQLHACMFNATRVHFTAVRSLMPNSKQKGFIFARKQQSFNHIVAAEDSQSTFSALQH